MQYKKGQYLREIEQVIAAGRFKDNWESLCAFLVPEWYRNAKFGIFIHWGVYSVPEYGSEWYAREMYREGTPEYKHHLETYGPHDKFGYRELIPLFTAEKFNAAEWGQLFADTGAGYVTPVAEHHDGFQMYDSDLSDYCAAKMGPGRDVLGELAEAVRSRGLTFCTSSHRAEHYWFMEGIRKVDNDNPDLQPGGLYWPSMEGPKDIYNVNEACPDEAYLEDWLIRTCELADKYRPAMIYFDWWIMNTAFKPYLKKFMAYYYNRGEEWGMQVCINYKFDACVSGTGVEDIERGQRKDIYHTLWQGDTSVARNSWSYTKGNDYKTPNEIIQTMIDIVSKNGVFMLNIGPKADGTIPDEDAHILKEIGRWMKVNGEAIYGTENWKLAGEGPALVEEGHFTEITEATYGVHDIRFTYKKGILYAFVLKWPKDGIVKVTSFAPAEKKVLVNVKSIGVLGFDEEVEWIWWEEGLTVKTGRVESGLPVCLKIEFV